MHWTNIYTNNWKYRYLTKVEVSLQAFIGASRLWFQRKPKAHVLALVLSLDGAHWIRSEAHVPWFQFARRAKTQRNNRRWKCLVFGLDWKDGVSIKSFPTANATTCVLVRVGNVVWTHLYYTYVSTIFIRVFTIDFHRDAIVFLHRTTHVYYFFGYDRYIRHIY